MGSYPVGVAIADKLQAEGIAAVCDPRSATPPCVLIQPANVTYDTGCGGTGEFQIFALSPGHGNADAWVALDELAAVVARVLPVEGHQYVRYPLSAETVLPAYRFVLTQGVDLE